MASGAAGTAEVDDTAVIHETTSLLPFADGDNLQGGIEHNNNYNNNSTNKPSTTTKRIQTFLIDFYDTNHFLLKAILAILIAKIYPPLGAEYLHPQITGQWIAVMFIFVLAGILIKTSELGTAVTQWKFNIFVLVYNFIGISMTVYTFTKLLLHYHLLKEEMVDGMIVCACMPISVSICIVFTRMAGGEVANATLIAPSSSLISVFLSPLLILFYMGTKTHIDLLSVFVKLLLRVLLPMVVGQILQRFETSLAFVENNLSKFKRAQEYALVYIVYTVFCQTFQESIDASLMDICWMAFYQNILLGMVTVVGWCLLSFFFHDERKLRVMGIFGCTQKSAAVGIPLIAAIYDKDPKLAGLYTLPLLIWHPSQIILGSTILPYLQEFVKRKSASELGKLETKGLLDQKVVKNDNDDDDDFVSPSSSATTTDSYQSIESPINEK